MRGQEASSGLRIMSRQRVLEELPAGSVLLFADSQYSIPLSTYQATTPLSNRSVDNSMPKHLLSDIVDPRPPKHQNLTIEY